MNKKERLKMVTDAGITSDDIDGYLHYLFPDIDKKEYSKEDTQDTINKILAWKQQDNGWEKRQ